MAEKRVKIDPGLFSSSEPDQPVEVPATGFVRPVSVGLRESEIELLAKLANDLNVARNSLLRFAIRRFLADVLAGRLDLSAYVEAPPPEPPRGKMKIP